jgi:hypothetical protein
VEQIMTASPIVTHTIHLFVLLSMKEVALNVQKSHPKAATSKDNVAPELHPRGRCEIRPWRSNPREFNCR